MHLGTKSIQSKKYHMHILCNKQPSFSKHKCPLPFLTDLYPSSFVSHVSLIPDTAAHSGRVSAAESVLPSQKAVCRIRCSQVLTLICERM